MDFPLDHPSKKKGPGWVLAPKRNLAFVRHQSSDTLLSVEKRRALLERFPALVKILVALKRLGLPKDLRHLIVWGKKLYLHFFLHETETLRAERILQWEEFEKTVQFRKLMRCILFETRYLRLEVGDLHLAHNASGKMFTRAHLDGQGHCVHFGLWARVRRPAVVE